MVAIPAAILIVWASIVGWMDLSWRRVTWWWSLIGIVGAGTYRLGAWVNDGFIPEQALLIFLVVTASYGLWRQGWWGGADAKMAMALIMAVPHLAFFAITSGVIALVSGVLLLIRGDGQRLRVLVSAISVGARFEDDDMRDDRVPVAAMMAAALLLYMFLSGLIL